MPIVAICEWCGRVFPTYPSRVADGRARFCAWTCRWAAARRPRRERGELVSPVECVCEGCGVVFLAEGRSVRHRGRRFHSHACYVAWGRRQSARSPGPRALVVRDEAFRAAERGRYAARQRYPLVGQLCESCGVAPAVEHHHLDHDPENNAGANVLLVCGRCHRRLHPGYAARVQSRRRDQTHCLHGHPLSGPNLYLDPKGHRRCRACRAQERLRRKEGPRHGGR